MRRSRSIGPVTFVLTAILSVWISTVWAETKSEEDVEPKVEQPYLVSAPADGVFNIVVLGDSLAAGLHQGLTQLNKKNDAIKTHRQAKVNTGLVRRDRYNWNKAAKKIARNKKYDIAVVVLGPNDLQSIREKGRAHHFQQEGWVTRYKDRLDSLIKDLKAGGKPVYWVSIPISGPRKYPKEYQYLNSLFREAAQANEIRYIDTWGPLANKAGKFDPYWRLENGKRIRFRMKDGIHFTPKGYEIFASLLNSVLLADMEKVSPKQAKAAAQ